MGAWDDAVLGDSRNEDFLDDLASLDDEDIVEAVRDACVMADSQGDLTEEESANALAAATIAAIWAGAPYSADEVTDAYPFIRELIGAGDERLAEAAARVLEEAETEEDLDSYLEALG